MRFGWHQQWNAAHRSTQQRARSHAHGACFIPDSSSLTPKQFTIRRRAGHKHSMLRSQYPCDSYKYEMKNLVSLIEFHPTRDLPFSKIRAAKAQRATTCVHSRAFCCRNCSRSWTTACVSTSQKIAKRVNMCMRSRDSASCSSGRRAAITSASASSIASLESAQCASTGQRETHAWIQVPCPVPWQSLAHRSVPFLDACALLRGHQPATTATVAVAAVDIVHGCTDLPLGTYFGRLNLKRCGNIACI